MSTIALDLLEVLDGADRMSPWAWAQPVAPPRPRNAWGHLDFRTCAARQWFERWEALMSAAIDMIDAGFAEFVGQADGEPALFAITDAGRGYLAEMRELSS